MPIKNLFVNAPSLNSSLIGVRLSSHFLLSEFLNLAKYPANLPAPQHLVNLAFGCQFLLEPARLQIGPILVTSGYRSPEVNRLVGGVARSQHLEGQAADIRPQDPAQFDRLVDILRANPSTDQLLTGRGWLHLSWNPFAPARHDIRLGYYK